MKYVETTHVVTNQPPALEGYDAFARDEALRTGTSGVPWLEGRLVAYGRFVGSAEAIALGFDANHHPPELRTHDRFGHRIDEVAYHPAYHALMTEAVAHQVHSIAWSAPASGGQLAHAALLYLHSQVEAGTSCPLTMTHASIPALRVERRLPQSGSHEFFRGGTTRATRPASKRRAPPSAWR